MIAKVKIKIQRGDPHECRAAVQEAAIQELERVLDSMETKCPECGAPFIKFGKKRYCNRACTRRAAWRRWTAANPRQRARVAAA